MTQPDLNGMSRRELRAYVIAHPHDQVAFHLFVDRCTAEASPETFDLPNSNAEVKEVDNLIRQKLDQLRMR